jgi:hypothetical protein
MPVWYGSLLLPCCNPWHVVMGALCDVSSITAIRAPIACAFAHRVRPSPHACTTNHAVGSEPCVITRIVCLRSCIVMGMHGRNGVASQQTRQQAVSCICTSRMSQTVTSRIRACHHVISYHTVSLSLQMHVA